jgi:hypothetical protein
LIRFRLSPQGDAAVEVLDPKLQTFADFVNYDLFGRRGVEDQLRIAGAVLDGTYTETFEGVERRLDAYERNHNAHRIVITPSTTTISQEEWGRSAEVPTPEYVAFLEELLRHADDR